MQKTLGGDRLGSGNKMKVHLHGYERSTHDLSYLWRSTMSAGTLVPFLCQIALPGDTFDINLNCEVMTHPTIGPLFGSYKVQLDVFQAPIRLYNSLLHNNALGIGLKMSNVKLPTISLTARASTGDTNDPDNSQINPSSLLAYLGIRGIGKVALEPTGRNFNATAILAYWEIYKQYYSNKMEEIGAVIHTPSLAIIQTVDAINIDGTTLPEHPATAGVLSHVGSEITIEFTGTQPLPNQIVLGTFEQGEVIASNVFGTFTATLTELTATQMYPFPLNFKYWRYRDDTNINQGTPDVVTFPLTNIDQARKSILSFSSETTPFNINTDLTIPPYSYLYEQPNNIPNLLSSQEGLALKTYQSDLFNAWLNTEYIDGTGGITEITAIDVSGGTLQIDALNLQQKVYNYLNRVAVSGGTYDDWLEVTYDHEPYRRCESPIYHGGLIRELAFQEVVSNAGGENEPLGTLAGKGIMTQKRKGGQVTIKVDEPAYLIGIISLTPRIDYSQGNAWDTHLETLDDLHKPALDEIGFQELLTENLAWWTTIHDGSDWITTSVGKQPAWINYMTNVNKTYGNFAIADNEMFMTLNRRYEFSESGILDLTTYIDPSKFNFIFAETALDAQNFWTQIAVDIQARRKMSAKVMPNT